MSGIGTLLSGKNSVASLLSQLNAAPSGKIIATPSSMSPAELATFNKTYIAGDGHGSSLHSSVKGGVRDVWITISPDHPNRSAFETPQYQVDMSGRHFWGSSSPQYIHHNKGNIDHARHLGLILGYASTTGEMYNIYVKGYVSTLPDNASAVKTGYDLLDMAKTLQASGDTQAAARVLVFAERVMGEQVTLLEGATAGLGDLVDGAKALPDVAKALAECGAAMAVLTNPVIYAASSAQTQAWAKETALAPVDVRAAFVPIAQAIDAAILDNNFAPAMRLAASGGGAGLAGKLGKLAAVGVAARLEGRVLANNADGVAEADGKSVNNFHLHEPGADWGGSGVVYGANVLKTAERTGLSPKRIEEVIAAGQGNRPAPSTYMSKAAMETHLNVFRSEGAVRITTTTDVAKRGTIGQADGGFVMAKSELDALVAKTGGDRMQIELTLGHKLIKGIPKLVVM